ncbi:Hypothetical predicted protein [Paramuricea clavata]|uniref:Uncharacterized protein n=1 Tax=Paramuricea clavata TaxID=317549 RepID=A0A7D9IIV5_PARCT|nr:Hypothetical predicted protein [Paramuricea clavata]
MCENFRRIEKIIFENDYDYLPRPWRGENDKELQLDLLHHVTMYIIQKQLHKKNKDEFLCEEIWLKKDTEIMDDEGFWYGTDIVDDLAVFYLFNNLVENVSDKDYLKPEKMIMLYKLYVDYTENGADLFYEKIYEFVEEELKGN